MTHLDPFGGDETLQMNGKFEGFPRFPFILWVGVIFHDPLRKFVPVAGSLRSERCTSQLFFLGGPLM